MNQYCREQAFNRLPTSTMQVEHYSAYQEASDQQDYQQILGLHNTHHFPNTTIAQASNDQMWTLADPFNRTPNVAAPPKVILQFAPSAADMLKSVKTNRTYLPHTAHQNTTQHTQHTNGTWFSDVSTAKRSVGTISSTSHQPVNRLYIQQNNHQPELSLQQTSPNIQSNQTAQRSYINQDRMRVGDSGSSSSANLSSLTSSRPEYRGHLNQTSYFVNQVPVQSNFQSSLCRRGNNVVTNSQIKNNINKSPELTLKPPPQYSKQHLVDQSQVNQKPQNPTVFLSKENIQHQTVFFGDLIKTSGQTPQQSNNVPTSNSYIMKNINTVSSRGNTHSEVVQSNNAVSRIPRISQDSTFSTLINKTPPMGSMKSHRHPRNLNKNDYKTLYINQMQVQNHGTNKNNLSSINTSPLSQFVAQQNSQGQSTGCTANVASCQQVQSAASQLLPVITNVSSKNLRNPDNYLEASCIQGFDPSYSRRMGTVSPMNENNGKVQSCKDLAELMDIVMALQTVTQKAVAVVSPISQKILSPNVNKSPDGSCPRINAAGTLLTKNENLEKQSKQLQSSKIKKGQIQSSIISKTLQSNKPDLQNSAFPQVPNSACTFDMIKKCQNTDSSKQENSVELTDHENNVRRKQISKIIDYLLQNTEHSQVKENINSLKDGCATESSVKENIFINEYQKINHVTETLNSAQTTKHLVAVPNIMFTNHMLDIKRMQVTETSSDGLYLRSLDSKQKVNGTNDGQTLKPSCEEQYIIKSSCNALNLKNKLKSLDNELNNDHNESVKDPAFDLSKAQVCNFTLENLHNLVKSLEVTPEKQENEAVVNIEERLMGLLEFSSIRNFTEECAATSELIELASVVAVKDEHEVVLQHLDTEHVTMLDWRHQILGDETYKPGQQEFKSWFNVDGPADIDSFLAEPVSDYELIWGVGNSQSVHDGTDYLLKAGTYDAQVADKTAAQSDRSDRGMTNDIVSKDMQEKDNNVDDSEDSEPITIKLISPEKAKLIFFEKSDCHFNQVKDLATPAINPQPHPELTEHELQSKIPKVTFNCSHLDTFVHGDDEQFCSKCLEEAPLFELDLEESCLSPLELNDQGPSPCLSKSDEEVYKSIGYKSDSIINSDPVIPKCNESKSTNISHAQIQTSGLLSDKSLGKEPLEASGKESDIISGLPNNFSNRKENVDTLNLGIPSKTMTKKNPPSAKFPPVKKPKCFTAEPVEDDQIPQRHPRDHNATSFKEKKNDQIHQRHPRDHNATSFKEKKKRIDQIKIAIPFNKSTVQGETIAKEKCKEKSNPSQVQKVKGINNHNSIRPHITQEPAGLANSDTNQEPHCFTNQFMKTKLALYGSSGNSGVHNNMVVHHCQERQKKNIPMYVTVSQSANASNNNKSTHTEVPFAKQKVLSKWSSTFKHAKYRTRKQGEVLALKWKIKDLKKQMLERNSIKRIVEGSSGAQEPKKLKKCHDQV